MVKLAIGGMLITGYQGGRWGIVENCTCLWIFSQGDLPGWSMIADDLNCPAHHPDSPKEAATW